MMMGCQRLIVPQVTNSLPADLMQPCPELRLLTGTTGQDIVLWSIDTANKYQDCKARHSALVDAVKIE